MKMAAGKIQKLIAVGGSGVLTYYGIAHYLDKKPVEAAETVVDKQHFVFEEKEKNKYRRELPSRSELVNNLKETQQFDVLVIGGGATGCGIALDATTRGLNTALVEMDDFSSGTSSRSTKLIHGGVRYLQKAILGLDYEQYRLVREALQERANLLNIAPHVSSQLPIMLPLYRWWHVPYYWLGIKAYDFVAGRYKLESSYYLSPAQALERFPMLKKDKLCGAIVYYDGQHNDARMNLSIALTAIRYGGTLVNHVMVTKLNKICCSGVERVCGAHCVDVLTGEEWDVTAKCVVNATGAFSDRIRHMDNPLAPCIIQPSAGVHVTLPDYYSPANMGLLDPSTSDGRVIFFLPWERHTLAGTTERETEVTHHPNPCKEDIDFILCEVKNYLSKDIAVRRGDVLSSWSGIRPLVLDPNKKDTQSIARNHVIEVSESGLVTVAGGKWTTYRSMAEDTVDTVIKTANDLTYASPCKTKGLLLEGADEWSPSMFIRLVQDYGLESEVAQHLAQTYGDKAFEVAKMAGLTGRKYPVVGNRIHSNFPYIEAEVRYAIREYAYTSVDVIGRRLRLSFLNGEAAVESLPKILSIMGEELKWSPQEKKRQHDLAIQFLNNEMGQLANKESRDEECIDILTEDEEKCYRSQFRVMDKGNKGYITLNDLRQCLQEFGEKVSEERLHEILNEVDLNKNGSIELKEYMVLMSAIKKGIISQSRLARFAEKVHQGSKIGVERSGGGV